MTLNPCRRWSALARRSGKASELKTSSVNVSQMDCHCFRLWHKGLSDLPERDVMTQLLKTFKTVKGFEERARQLADSYGTYFSRYGSREWNNISNTVGITLDRPPAPPTSESDNISTGTPHTNTTSTDHSVTESTPHTSPPVSVTERTPHSSVIDSNSEGGSDVESSHSLPALHRPVHTTQVRYYVFRIYF